MTYKDYYENVKTVRFEEVSPRSGLDIQLDKAMSMIFMLCCFRQIPLECLSHYGFKVRRLTVHATNYSSKLKSAEKDRGVVTN